MFLHPEQYLDDFVLRGGYDTTRWIASQTTIYCHSNDEALKSAELLSSGRKCMGRHPFGYVRARQSAQSIELTTTKKVRVATDASPDRFRFSLDNRTDWKRAYRTTKFSTNSSPMSSISMDDWSPAANPSPIHFQSPVDTQISSADDGSSLSIQETSTSWGNPTSFINDYEWLGK